MGVAVGRLRQRRPRRRLHHRARRRPAVSQRGRRQVPRRDEGGRHRERQLRHQRRLARLRQRRQGSICSSPTTSSGAAKSDLWCSLDGATKSYCTPESYKGTASKLYRNLGGGKFEDVSQQGRGRRSQQQVARRRRARLQQRRLARPLRRQRHAAEQAVSQPDRTARSPRKALQAGVAFGEDGVARGAMGVDAADYDRSGRPHLLVGNSRTRCSASITTRGTGCSWTRRRASTVGARACCRSPSACSSSTTTSTASPTSSPPTATSKRRSGACSRRCSTEQPPLLFRNLGKGKFENVSAAAGRRSSAGRSSRAARPTATIDRDGDLDVLFTDQPRPGVPVPQRRRQPQQLAARAHRGREVESRRHRRRGAGDERRRASSGAWCAAAPATARRATWR